MEIIQKLLAGDSMKWILVAVIVINAALSAVAGALEVVGKSDKAPAAIKVICGILKKIIDIASANLKH